MVSGLDACVNGFVARLPAGVDEGACAQTLDQPDRCCDQGLRCLVLALPFAGWQGGFPVPTVARLSLCSSLSTFPIKQG
jgi:hypothetical protein